MKQFVALYNDLDQTTRTTEKVGALEKYFREAPPEDACWGLYFLAGGRTKRAVNTRLLREWAAEESGLPLWLIEECYDAVGDLAETIALILPHDGAGTNLPLHRLAEERILPLPAMNEDAKRELVSETWQELNARERLVWHKLIGGGWRAGVAKKLVLRALANVAGIEPAVMEHRFAGGWEPTAENYERLLSQEDETAGTARPYPFCLAYQFDDPPETMPEKLGDAGNWQVEWKWDGIRAQVIRRDNEVLVWSRGEEMITERFPEVEQAARALPNGTVLDGEILVWGDDRPRPFGDLQRRIGRKTVGKKLLKELPAAFMAYDLLEENGEDIRGLAMSERRARLEKLIGGVAKGLPLHLSETVERDTWEELAELREESRKRGVEGFMVKRKASPYGVGRTVGDWWKWKVDPFSADCVLIYAQRGHGRRASLYTDYTFGVWDGDELVPVMKAYSGLTDKEFREVDRFIRRNTREKFGPVRTVMPELVFELHFEGIRESTRHKSGIAVRFPRMHQWRRDKKPEEADTLENLRGLLKIAEGNSG